jgi:hypothetical protein
MPHRFQPIPADLDLAKTALDRAPQIPAESAGRAHNPKVAGSNFALAQYEPCDWFRSFLRYSDHPVLSLSYEVAS